jgi:DNA-binding response OmpR family regulator
MKNILLVHDQQESATPRKSFLEVSGYAVDLVGHGDEVLLRVEAQRPDLVLMDVLLEGPNGFEVCRRLRSKWGPDELPILLSSGIYRSRIYRDEATNAGAQGYILKPCEPDELVREVSEILARVESRMPA